jgi:hypothetical protein
MLHGEFWFGLGAGLPDVTPIDSSDRRELVVNMQSFESLGLDLQSCIGQNSVKAQSYQFHFSMQNNASLA